VGSSSLLKGYGCDSSWTSRRPEEAESYYGPKQLADRRRQARMAGLRTEDAGRVEVDFDLAATLRAYDESAVWDAAGSVALAA
jgi:hypothetical protein